MKCLCYRADFGILGNPTILNNVILRHLLVVSLFYVGQVAGLHSSFHVTMGWPLSSSKESGNHTYPQSDRFHSFHLSPTKVNLSPTRPSSSATGKTYVDCERKVVSAPSPCQGLPNSAHGPRINVDETADRAGFGRQAVQPDPMK
jgi:hypothetical protein